MKRKARQEAKVFRATAQGHKPRTQLLKALRREGRYVVADFLTLNEELDIARVTGGVK